MQQTGADITVRVPQIRKQQIGPSGFDPSRCELGTPVVGIRRSIRARYRNPSQFSRASEGDSSPSPCPT
jgi:hypothetical protein